MGFVQELLDRNGVWTQESRDASGTKKNLHAIIGPMRAGGLALSGHVDTVPVDGQRWAGDPFRCAPRAAGSTGAAPAT